MKFIIKTLTLIFLMMTQVNAQNKWTARDLENYIYIDLKYTIKSLKLYRYRTSVSS